MELVFISGVTLGFRAWEGITDSDSFKEGSVTIKAVFGLAMEKASRTSGFRSFEGAAALVGADFHEVTTIRTDTVIDVIDSYRPDLICIIGWSELALPRLLDIPKMKHYAAARHGPQYGCIGIHPTMLPRGRGHAPIPWSIIKGLDKSGVTLFYLEESADSGDIIDQRPFDISPDDDASTVYSKVANLHYDLMRDNLPLLVSGSAKCTPQSQGTATVWRKRNPDDGEIQWHWSALRIHNWVRALTRPYPGSFTFFRKKKLLIWKSRVLPLDATLTTPGSVVALTDDDIVVSCADGVVVLLELQMEGGPVLKGRAFAERNGMHVGDCFSRVDIC